MTLPVINDYWERAEFPWQLIKKMGALGIVGDGSYGCPAMATARPRPQHQRWIRGR
jgi:glutaryl-CoA dehydrogenase